MQEVNKIEQKRNICIATWYGPHNFGTGLQAYALSWFLTQKGFHTFFAGDYYLDEKEDIFGNPKKSKKIVEIINKKYKGLYRLISGIRKHQKAYFSAFEERARMQEAFLKKYNEIFPINNEEDVKVLNEQTDLFLAGSDQIWNPYVIEHRNFLQMADQSKPLVSYASSVGVEHIPEKYINIYVEYLSRFSTISVREKQSKEALENILKDRVITEVLDPTLLIHPSDWSSFATEAVIAKERFKEPYIFCYFVGGKKSYWDYVHKMQSTMGLRVVVLPITDEAFMNPFDKFVRAAPNEFLWLIQHAALVCTDSFHASLFSIQFQREFYVLKRFEDKDPKSQNGRLVNILSKMGLEDRIVSNEQFFIRRDIDNYFEIHQKLDMLRAESANWLLNAINDSLAIR